MARRRLVWRLFITYLLVIVLCTAGATVHALRSVGHFYREQTDRYLQARCRLAERQVAKLFASGQTDSLDALAKDLGERTDTRFTIIGMTGRVLGDSEAAPAAMDNHAGRPEVAQALAGETGTTVRYSQSVRGDLMYVAVPVRSDGRVVAVLRAALPLTAVHESLSALSRRIWLGGLATVLAAAVLAMLEARRISRPVAEMARVAERFQAGQLGHKVEVPSTPELARLAEALNRMAAGLKAQIEALARHNSRYEALLSSMGEAVVTVDAGLRILSMNEAAGGMFEVDPARVVGRTLQEVARNVLLERFVSHLLAQSEPLHGELVLHGGSERHVRARGGPLKDADGRVVGALVVLNDMTELHRLENVRKDFVANVSHELRTPVTAIQGFVETLRGGGVEDPEKARHFLDIIGAQSGRLSKIIDDLLSLSRIEREAEAHVLEKVPVKLKDVLHAAVADSRLAAEARQIPVELSCPEDLEVPASPHLVEQAVANLLDNAIKYSEPGSRVAVEAEQAGTEAVIRVRDQGCGIPRKDLSRIFERFYYVDKARSRKMGGTGLGLSIVKHIAQAHGGRVEVQSAPGEGSVFSIHLPLAVLSG